MVRSSLAGGAPQRSRKAGRRFPRVVAGEGMEQRGPKCGQNGMGSHKRCAFMEGDEALWMVAVTSFCGRKPRCARLQLECDRRDRERLRLG